VINFFADSSNQRKIAVALAAAVALFAQKIPFLAEVTPERIEWILGLVAVWVAQSGAKAMVQAHADGKLAVAEAQKVSPADALAASPKP
jgi:hypothetical protein